MLGTTEMFSPNSWFIFCNFQVTSCKLLMLHWCWFFWYNANLRKIFANALSSCGPHRNADFLLICAAWNSSIGNPLQRHSPGSINRSGGGHTSLKTLKAENFEGRKLYDKSAKFWLTNKQSFLTIRFCHETYLKPSNKWKPFGFYCTRCCFL